MAGEATHRFSGRTVLFTLLSGCPMEIQCGPSRGTNYNCPHSQRTPDHLEEYTKVVLEKPQPAVQQNHKLNACFQSLSHPRLVPVPSRSCCGGGSTVKGRKAACAGANWILSSTEADTWLRCGGVEKSGLFSFFTQSQPEMETGWNSQGHPM